MASSLTSSVAAVADPASAPRLSDVIEVLDAAYPRSLAEDWDAVGLVCGDLDARVRTALLVVDVTPETVDEALGMRAELIVAHHPLLLSGVHGVGTDSYRGQLVHRLISAGCALFTAHTNADVAAPGVSDALARMVGLTDLTPLDPLPVEALDKVVTFVPEAKVDEVTDALAAAGAGAVGEYQRAAWTTTGTGTFEPGPRANPAVGEPGRREQVAETRLELVLPRPRRHEVVTALRTAHPYEEPAFDVLELAAWPGPRGLGRVGRLETPLSLQAFAESVFRALPRTRTGVRVAGPLDKQVERIAVCGGSGSSLVDRAAAAGADAYLTADLRHHTTADAVAEHGLALVDVAHWASEWPWLVGARETIAAGLDTRGMQLAAHVSATSTDPWTVRL